MRIVSLDGLRGVAALAVAVPHFLVVHEIYPTFFEAISIVAVEVFFVLSGFVLAPQIHYCLQSGSIRNLLVFYCRRWMRTLPPYVIALLTIALLTANLFTPQFFKYLFFVQNIASIDSANDFFPVAWSLSIEEWFYVVFPIFLFTMKRFGSGVIRSGVIFLALFFVLKVVGAVFYPDWGLIARRLVLFRLDSIAFGFLLHFLLADSRGHVRAQVRRFSLAVHVVAIVAMAGTMTAIYAGGGTLIRFVYFYIAALFGSSLIAVLYIYNDKIVKSRLAERVSAFLGAISYDIYLFHITVMLLISRVQAPLGGTLLLYIAGILLLSCAIRWGIENRILAARPRYPALPHTESNAAREA